MMNNSSVVHDGNPSVMQSSSFVSDEVSTSDIRHADVHEEEEKKDKPAHSNIVPAPAREDDEEMHAALDDQKAGPETAPSCAGEDLPGNFDRTA